MSSFFILSMTSITRPALVRSGSARSRYSIVGTICYERPKRSFTQPHCSASGTADRAFQYRSSSDWFSHGIVNETASLNLKYGPPFRPLNFWPINVKSTDRTSPFFPLGKSAGAVTTVSIREPGNKDVENFAAATAWPSNQRHGTMLSLAGFASRVVGFFLVGMWIAPCRSEGWARLRRFLFLTAGPS